MTDFGQGIPLKQFCSYLQDDAERIDRILDVTERNSIIEGLPPFDAAIRLKLRQELLGTISPTAAPAE